MWESARCPLTWQDNLWTAGDSKNNMQLKDGCNNGTQVKKHFHRNIDMDHSQVKDKFCEETPWSEDRCCPVWWNSEGIAFKLLAQHLKIQHRP